MRTALQIFAIVCLSILAPLSLGGEGKPASPESGAAKPAKLAEPGAKAVTLEEALERKINCEFIESPIQDVFAFVRALGNINLIVSRSAQQNGTINLRVTDMRIHDVLSWVCRLADLEMEIVDQAIFIRASDNVEQRLGKALPPPIAESAKFRMKLGNGNEIEADGAIFNSKPELLEKLVERFLQEGKK